jgi:hypothetical protein
MKLSELIKELQELEKQYGDDIECSRMFEENRESFSEIKKVDVFDKGFLSKVYPRIGGVGDPQFVRIATEIEKPILVIY